MKVHRHFPSWPSLLVTAGLVAVVIARVVVAAPDSDCRNRLLQAIEMAVCARHGVPADRVKITPYAVQLPSGCEQARQIRIQIPDFADAIGAVTVRAVFEGDRGIIGTIPVPVKVDLFADVLVTARRLGRHEVIRPEDLMRRRQMITDVAKWVMADPDSVVGHWTDRTINAGQMVDRRWVVDVPLVRRGERVLVAYDVGVVRVSTAAVAVEDGYRGQQIRVKPYTGRQLLTVRVVDDKTVRPIPQ
jgi:flagella basal body P-ring formation protein FlgA